MSESHFTNPNPYGRPWTGKKRPHSVSEEAWFWSKVEKTDSCWNWKGTFKQGAPFFFANRRQGSAMRYSLLLVGIVVPTSTKLIYQTCGNRACVNPAHLKPHSFEDAFWDKVEKTDGCWFWRGGVYKTGYGEVWLPKGRRGLAHRFSWEFTNGPIPKGMNVLHKCDVNYPPGDITNRLCVNPDHLFLGTHADNVADMVSKRRQAFGRRHVSRVKPEAVARGSRSGMAKLSEEDIPQIRQIHEAGLHTLQEIGGMFGVSPNTISRIVRRIDWAHIE